MSFTEGAHARKSWILSRYALGDGYRVGIIAGSPDSYDPKFWLVSRRGIWGRHSQLSGLHVLEVLDSISQEGVSKLNQPNPERKMVAGAKWRTRRREACGQTFSRPLPVPRYTAAARAVSVETCLDDGPGLNGRTLIEIVSPHAAGIVMERK